MNEPLAIARAVHFAATLLLTGCLAFQCFVAMPVPHTDAGVALKRYMRPRLAWTVWAAFAAALASGAAWLVLLSAEIGDMPVAEALSQGLPGNVLTQTTFGHAWMVRLAIAAALAMLLLAHSRLRSRGMAKGAEFIVGFMAAVLAAAFAAGLAWTGHAADMEGLDGAVHLASDALHLVAAAAWLGGLAPLALLLAAARRSVDPAAAGAAHCATRRFSILGMISVAAILATGAVNTWEILGPDAFFADSDYNRLLWAKIALLFVMVAIAAFNRQRLTPRLSAVGDHGRAMRQLQWNSLIETALGLLILAIVAVLGRMTPPMGGMMHGGM